MIILKWMDNNMLKDRMKNEIIQVKLEVAPTEDKMKESSLRQFGHVRRRHTYVTRNMIVQR